MHNDCSQFLTRATVKDNKTRFFAQRVIDNFLLINNVIFFLWHRNLKVTSERDLVIETSKSVLPFPLLSLSLSHTLLHTLSLSPLSNATTHAFDLDLYSIFNATLVCISTTNGKVDFDLSNKF